MKKKFLFLMTLLAVSLLALAEMAVYVYKKDGTNDLYVASTVDSIGFVDVTLPEAVDLGLPSGAKWANMNVGANKPEDYGDYFAWGETTPKSTFTSSNYNYSSDPTTLPLDKDAAYINWGGDWRMPTKSEQDELLTECTWTWTTLNGVNGYKVTSKINGNSIFLPAAGFRSSSGFHDAGSIGDYWSSSLYTDDSILAYELDFGSDVISVDHVFRHLGLSVRAVLRE